MRIFFSVLTLLAAAVTLTIEVTEWWKYVPVGSLALITLILWIFRESTFRSNDIDLPDNLELDSPQEEETLEDFGILDVRPMNSKESESDKNELDPTGDTPNNGSSSRGIQLTIPIDPSPAESDVRRNSAKTNDPLHKNVLVPVLQGFRTALDAHAVGIIRPVSDDYDYRIVGTVGMDWLRSSGESFVLKYDLLQKSENTAIHNVGSNGLQSNHLTYTRIPASITSLGVTVIGQTGNLLIVDTINEKGLYHPRAKELLEIFGQTFSLLLYTKDPNRPRHEIITEEMENARHVESDLAFALVIPKRAEKLAKTYTDFLDEIERPLADCLLRAAPDSRVIKFGELLYGVFTNGEKDAVRLWHQSVQNEIDSQGGLLTGGVLIGVAIMNEHHQTPDDLRNDAKHALTEAYNGPIDTVII